MSQLFLKTEDQIHEYERIFFEAKNRWSTEKNPSYLKIQIDCLKAIRALRYNIDNDLTATMSPTY